MGMPGTICPGKESAAENKPPDENPVRVKRRGKSPPGTGVIRFVFANPSWSKTK